jgi:hypothetical protein
VDKFIAHIPLIPDALIFHNVVSLGTAFSASDAQPRLLQPIWFVKFKMNLSLETIVLGSQTELLFLCAETVTYMLKGTFVHQDFTGHKGTINPGDVQWMTAGKGIVHSEIPASDDAHGLQLWVNLAAKDKM